MREITAIIERVRSVNSSHQHVEAAVDAGFSQLKPGQSVLARAQEGWEPYLLEQWWPVAADTNKVTFERPLHQVYEPGQTVQLIGPIGQPFRFRRTLRNVLLIAYETEPSPLLMTIPPLLSNRVSVTLVLLGGAASYATDHLAPEVEVMTGDADMNWHNRVTTIGWADQVFVVTPQTHEIDQFRRVYELFSHLRAEVPQGYLFGVFRPALPCGVGACGACLLRLRDQTVVVCSQGPAFDLTQVLLG